MAGYISDGYTRDDGYIAPARPEESGEKLYEALSFTYRPATRMEVVKLDAQMKNAARNIEIDPEAAVKSERLACDFVASKILTWDLKDIGVHDVPVSSKTCERLHPYLFERLFAIIRGVAVSDKCSHASEPPKTDEEQQKN